MWPSRVIIIAVQPPLYNSYKDDKESSSKVDNLSKKLLCLRENSPAKTAQYLPIATCCSRVNLLYCSFSFHMLRTLCLLQHVTLLTAGLRDALQSGVGWVLEGRPKAGNVGTMPLLSSRMPIQNLALLKFWTIKFSSFSKIFKNFPLYECVRFTLRS